MERLGLEKDAAPEFGNRTIVIAHEQLVKLKLSLPTSLSLVLSHAKPRTSTNSILQAESQLERDLQSQIQTQSKASGATPSLHYMQPGELQQVYQRTHLDLREWAYRVGILAEECKLMSETFLQILLARVFRLLDFQALGTTAESTLFPQYVMISPPKGLCIALLVMSVS